MCIGVQGEYLCTESQACLTSKFSADHPVYSHWQITWFTWLSGIPLQRSRQKLLRCILSLSSFFFFCLPVVAPVFACFPRCWSAQVRNEMGKLVQVPAAVMKKKKWKEDMQWIPVMQPNVGQKKRRTKEDKAYCKIHWIYGGVCKFKRAVSMYACIKNKKEDKYIFLSGDYHTVHSHTQKYTGLTQLNMSSKVKSI